MIRSTVALIVMMIASPALAHGQHDHSIPGTAIHAVTDLAHAPAFWAGLSVCAVVAGLALHRRKAVCQRHK